MPIWLVMQLGDVVGKIAGYVSYGYGVGLWVGIFVVDVHWGCDSDYG